MKRHDHKDKDKTKTFKEHPQRTIPETFDLRLDTDLTLETLITFQAIENNIFNSYIVTLE